VSERDLDELERLFERDGFVNAGRVVDEAEAAALGEELDRHVDQLFFGNDRGLSRPFYVVDIGKSASENHYQLCGMWKVSERFRRLIENSRLVQIAARLARATTLQVWSDTVQYKRANQGAPFSWHQDAPYHISILPASRLLGAWVAFDDADVESGCMWMVPGSHRWGEQERHLWQYSGLDDPEKFGQLGPPPDVPAEASGDWRGSVACPVRAGEVHFHHALTWHGSPANRSSRPRRAYTIHYMPEGTLVSERSDVRVPFPPGTPMIDTGPDFPIVYQAPR